MSWLLRVCLVLTAITACGTVSAAAVDIKPPVAVVSMLGGDATLVTVGMTAFGNSAVQKAAPELDMDAYLAKGIAAAIAQDGSIEPAIVGDSGGISGSVTARPGFFRRGPTQEVIDKVLASVPATSGTLVAVLSLPTPVLQTSREKEGYGLAYLNVDNSILTFVSAEVVVLDVASRAALGLGYLVGERRLGLKYVPTEEERAREEAELRRAIEEAETFGSEEDPREMTDYILKPHHTAASFSSVSAKDREYIFNQIRELAASGLSAALQRAKLLD